MNKKLIISVGKKYTFTEIDKKKFDVKYIDNINESILSKIKNDFLIFNNEDKEYEKLNINKKIFKIEDFLNKHLKKIYIPKDKNIRSKLLESVKPYTTMEYILKRIIDFTILIPLLIISLPIVLYSAYRIKKESPDGPILFKQKRVGKDGKEFICYKFRSMVPDAEKDKPKFATKDDPRVFKWGRIMRKTRIDEIPQIINVLKGEMHIIGPRPERKYWIEQFEKEIPFYNLRHIVSPGITGWAQVNYPYGDSVEDAYQKLMYDLYYIKNWSLWLELKIIFKTIYIMISRKGH